MIYPSVDLRTAGLLVGVALLVLHAAGILHSETIQRWLQSFPRSRNAGMLLLTIAAVWSFVLIATMDLGEFTSFRKMLLIVIPAAYFLTLKFVPEFLAVRALGMILLLLAEPVLEAAFLRPETSRLLLVVLAYAWALLGMFYVGMPYVMRDQISWLLKPGNRWRTSCLAGLGYGAAVLIFALTQYR
jgi:hypothetical protein